MIPLDFNHTMPVSSPYNQIPLSKTFLPTLRLGEECLTLWQTGQDSAKAAGSSTIVACTYAVFRNNGFYRWPLWCGRKNGSARQTRHFFVAATKQLPV